MKKLLLHLTICISVIIFKEVRSQRIYTVAGKYSAGLGYSGDGGPATAAEMHNPWCVATDGAVNIYIADYNNYCIRKVNNAGIISTFAGNGINGFRGDGGPATSAELSNPGGVASDAAGNIYIADAVTAVIRKVNTSGIISTIAGIPFHYGYSGDGGPASSAEISPFALSIDGIGNIYISDGNTMIRKINTSGIISTYGGIYVTAGYTGDGGPATAAELNGTENIANDATGNLYIADYFNSVIRMINTSGIISTVIGNGVNGNSGDGGPASAAELSIPYAIATDGSGNLYLSESAGARKVNTSGIISTYAGNYLTGYSGDGGLATAAKLGNIYGLATDGAGNLYIADEYDNVIREVTSGSPLIVEATRGIKQELPIYPNPNHGVFKLRLSMENQSEETVAEIYNMLGDKVYTSNLTSNNIEINLSNQPNGVYLYRITNKAGESVSSGKFIIQ